MKSDYCICGKVATVGAICNYKGRFSGEPYCDRCWNLHKQGKQRMEPTHVRIKTNKQVYVERHEGGTVVVKGKNGTIHGSYSRTEMGKFYKRYRSLVAVKQTDDIK